MLALFALALATTPAVAALPPCAPSQLSLAFDGQGGAFNGMSHSGALLVIRNMGPKACRLPALPRLLFKDAKGRPLPIARQSAAGARAVGVAAGAELTAPLRWVSGEVYDRSRCLTPAYAAVAVGSDWLQIEFTPRLCGRAGATIAFEQPALRPDPRL